MKDFNTLLDEKDLCYKDRWSPHTVEKYEKFLKDGVLKDMKKSLLKNIVYSLMYLEFLKFELDSLKLHNVVERSIMKIYIIIVMSVVEGVFYQILLGSGKYRKEEWEQTGRDIHTNVFDDERGTKTKYVISVLSKLDKPILARMDFEEMINRVQEKNLLAMSGRKFPYIKELKRIRNRVHLHIAESDMDTDYWLIERKHYLFSRYILLEILTDKKIGTSDSKVLDEIQLSEDEFEELTKEYPKVFIQEDAQ